MLLREFAGFRGAPREELPYNSMAAQCLEAKQKQLEEGDLVGAGRAAQGAAEALRRVGDIRSACSEWRSASELIVAAEDEVGLGWALFTEGNLLRQLSNFQAAGRALERATRIASANRQPGLLMYAVAGLAETTRIAGDYALSQRQHQSMLRAFTECNDKRGQVWALEGLGQILRSQCRVREALDYFEAARKLASECGDLRGLGYAHKCCGECLSELGHQQSAIDQVSQGTALFSALGFQVGLGYSIKALGDLLFRERAFDSAQIAYQQALDVFRQINDKRGIAYTTNGLAAVARTTDAHLLGAVLYAQAYGYFKKHGVRLGAEKSLAGARRIAKVARPLKSEVESLFHDAFASQQNVISTA